MNDVKSIAEILERDGVYVGTTSGVSMKPMLRDRRDTVVIVPATERLKKYDVALFTQGGRCFLHRVVKVLPDGYLTCGDNCSNCERVNEGDVLGVLREIYRGDKHSALDSRAYALYSRLTVLHMPLRIGARRVVRIFVRRKKRG